MGLWFRVLGFWGFRGLGLGFRVLGYRVLGVRVLGVRVLGLGVTGELCRDVRGYIGMIFGLHMDFQGL